MAQLHIRPESREGFEAAVGRALDVLAAAPGCQEARVLFGIEGPDEPCFVIRWDSVEAHETFRETPEFADYRATIAEFFSAPPSYRHFQVGPTGEGSR
jgi:quinol monooxygenase YgiN